MISKIREEWKNEISLAKQKSQKPQHIRAFKDFAVEQALRASYFTEMASVINNLGLSNPHERSALSIEPTHPVPPRYLSNAVDSLGINSKLRTTYNKAKLSLISLAMLECYSPDSDATRMRKGSHRAPLYLLDPLYGFAYFRGKDRLHNHCFAIDLWSSHLSSMPKDLANDLWSRRSDSMLSGGAFAGRVIFKEMLALETDPLKRCTVPAINVSSEIELCDLVAKLKAAASASEFPNMQLWFRGQTKDYITPDRLELSKLGITPYSNIRESDFTPSLYRKYDSFLENSDSFENLVIELAEWVHCAKLLVPSHNIQEHLKSPVKGAATLKKDGLSSYQRGLLLQQYGAPSAYLDITSDSKIAAWFATHSCSTNDEGKMLFKNYSWSSSDPESWPTIFIFPLVKGVHPYLDLESILEGSDALRPERQKCGLLGGSGNLARNYCARYLGLKIRLSPSFKLSNPVPASELFPPPSEDRALSFLKEQGLDNSKRHFVISELASIN